MNQTEKNILSLEFPVAKKASKNYDTVIHTWDLSEQLSIECVLKDPKFSNFVKCGKITKNKDKVCGYDIEITNKNFKNKTFVLYLLVIHNKVLKCGKVKDSLDKRSYSAGTSKSWVEQGTPSEPNYIYSQIFRECLEKGVEIDFYCKLAPVEEITFEFFGETITQLVSSYEECEVIMKKALETLKGGKLIGEGALLERFKK